MTNNKEIQGDDRNNVQLQQKVKDTKVEKVAVNIKPENSVATANTINGLKRAPDNPKRLEPTRYGDWEKKGRCIDF